MKLSSSARYVKKDKKKVGPLAKKGISFGQQIWAQNQKPEILIHLGLGSGNDWKLKPFFQEAFQPVLEQKVQIVDLGFVFKPADQK